MFHRRIDLHDKGAYLMSYVHSRYEQDWEDVGEWVPSKRPVILILAGGGYAYCSEREAEPVVYPFLNAGYNAFTLFYRTGEASSFPGPLEDVFLAIWHIRKNAAEYGIDKDKITVGGFSAGGNLSAMAATQWHKGDWAKRLGIPEGGNKPNAALLCYTPVEWKDGSVNSSVGAIVRESPPELSPIEYVDKNTPPCFIWHTVEDEKVSAANALAFAQRCFSQGVPFELHLYQYGQHGLSLNTDLTAYKHEHPVNVETWVPLCVNWLNKLFAF